MTANKMGRPSLYSEELIEEICQAVANSSKGLIELCKENSHWPVPQVIRRWKRDNSDFSSKYAQAKVDQCDYMAEEIIKIADDSSRDTFVDENGNKRCDTEWIGRSRLRVDVRKWYTSKLAPKLYGDKLQHEGNLSIRDEITEKIRKTDDEYSKPY